MPKHQLSYINYHFPDTSIERLMFHSETKKGEKQSTVWSSCNLLSPILTVFIFLTFIHVLAAISVKLFITFTRAFEKGEREKTSDITFHLTHWSNPNNLTNCTLRLIKVAISRASLSWGQFGWNNVNISTRPELISPTPLWGLSEQPQLKKGEKYYLFH